MNGGTSQIKYAKRLSGNNTLQVIDSDASFTIAARSSLAIDNANNIHVSYGKYHTSYSTDELRYAHNTSGTWAHEAADIPDESGDLLSLGNAIALDNTDDIHIIHRYFDDSAAPSSELLRYISGTSGSFSTSTIAANNGITYSDMSIAVDSSNDLHTIYAYQSGGTANIFHRSYNGTTWSTESNLTPSDCSDADYLQMAIDTANEIHVAFICKVVSSGECSIYYNKSSSGIFTADDAIALNTLKGSSCNFALMEEKYRPSLALDSAGRAHVTSFDQDNDEISYRFHTVGAWSNITNWSVAQAPLASVALEGELIMLLDAGNNPYIYALDGTTAKLLSKNSGSWQTITIDTDVYGLGEGAISGKQGRSQH
jgi:hypothetical protein